MIAAIIKKSKRKPSLAWKLFFYFPYNVLNLFTIWAAEVNLIHVCTVFTTEYTEGTEGESVFMTYGCDPNFDA